MRLMYGLAMIRPDVRRNRNIYSGREPHFLKCACPGCQNFFAGVKPYVQELDASLSPLGLAWDKPDSISVMSARDGEVSYRAVYIFFGEGQFPKPWLTEKNELGSVSLRNPDAVYTLNDRMSYVFTPLRKGRIKLELFAGLPWVMETVNCIYEEDCGAVAKKLPSRPKRIFRAAAHVIRGLRK